MPRVVCGDRKIFGTPFTFRVSTYDWRTHGLWAEVLTKCSYGCRTSLAKYKNNQRFSWSENVGVILVLSTKESVSLSIRIAKVPTTSPMLRQPVALDSPEKDSEVSYMMQR